MTIFETTVPATSRRARSSARAQEELLRITGGRGVDYILGTTGSAEALVALAVASAIRGTLALVDAAAPGTHAPFEIGMSLTKGWRFKTIVQGS